MEPSLVLSMLAWCLGSFVGGLCGLGEALIAMPLMLVFLSMHEVVPISCLVALPLVTVKGLYYLRFARKDVLLHLLSGVLPGAFLGLQILKFVPGHALQIALGLLITGFSLFLIFGPRPSLRERPLSTFLVGVLGGACGTAVSADGPVLGLYCVMVGWQPQAWLGIGSAYFVLRNLASCSMQWYEGLYSPLIWHHALWTIPAALLGFAASIPLVRYIDVERLRNIIKAVLLLAGISCLVRAF